MSRRETPDGTLAGVAIAALAAACFATKGVFAKQLYAHGWTADAVLTVRMVLALPLVVAWAAWRVGPRALRAVPRRAMLAAAAAGFLCYYVGALLDFHALTLIDVGVERVLLFAYPSMVVVLYSLLYREWPDARVLAAIALTYAGILAVVTGFDPAVLRANAAGAGLVLACALTFAIYYLVSDRFTPSIGALPFTTYALATATACLVVHHLVRADPTPVPWAPGAAATMAGLVVIATVVPMIATAEGVRRLGAQRAALVSTVGPPTTILLGAWLLDERMSGPQWTGVALILAGILVLEVARRKAAAPEPD